MKVETSPRIVLKEKISPGGINTPLNFEEATPTLCTLEAIEPENFDDPFPTSSMIPRLLTSAVVILGDTLSTGISIVEDESS